MLRKIFIISIRRVLDRSEERVDNNNMLIEVLLIEEKSSSFVSWLIIELKHLRTIRNMLLSRV